MDKLWAPWRAQYVSAVLGKIKGCVFCRIAKAEEDKKNYVFIRSAHSFAVLNIYPYNNGHSLVVPYRHVKDLGGLRREEKEDLLNVVESVTLLLDSVLKPGGYNIGMNLGRLAGAGFPNHLHMHIVPRWKGDANFMPVISDTRVISASLKSMYEKLTDAHKKRNRRART